MQAQFSVPEFDGLLEKAYETTTTVEYAIRGIEQLMQDGTPNPESLSAIRWTLAGAVDSLAKAREMDWGGAWRREAERKAKR